MTRPQQLASLDNATLVRKLLAAEQERDAETTRANDANEQAREYERLAADMQCCALDAEADCDNLRTELTTARATIQRLQLERDGAMVQRNEIPERVANIWTLSLKYLRSDLEAAGWCPSNAQLIYDCLHWLTTKTDPDLLALAEAGEDEPEQHCTKWHGFLACDKPPGHEGACVLTHHPVRYGTTSELAEAGEGDGDER
jgi:hypothetical protein